MFGEEFITAADIDDDAETLVAAGYSARNGDYLSVISLYKTNSEIPIKEIEITGEQPYRVKISRDGVFAAFDNSFRAYDFDGEESANYNFAGRKLQAAAFSAGFAAIALNEKTLGTNDRLLIFDSRGDIIYENTVGAEIIDMQFSADQNYLYFLTRDGLHKINTGDGAPGFVTSGYDETARKIIRADENKIYMSGRSKIIAVEVEVETETEVEAEQN